MKPLFLSLLLSCTVYGRAGDGEALLGTWRTDEGDLIEIYACGDHYCGRIADIVEKTYGADDPLAGRPKVDRENPEPHKRDTPVIGLVIMQGFVYKDKAAQWQDGTIYDPNNGKTYKCKITLKDGRLRVRGYIGIPTLGRTEIWQRN